MSEINVDTTIWKSLILPVVAAIVTTLIVEMFAKPSLEARKNRLIRDRQQVDEVIFQFQKVSMSIAALLPDSIKKTTIQNKHNQIMLDNASQGLYGLIDALSRLSHKYAHKHKEHIGKTTIFIGYLMAKVETQRTLPVMDKLIDGLKKDASDLQYFDTYFVANVGLKDSQEKWYKRIYWRLSEKDDAKVKTLNILKKHKLIKSGRS